MGNQNNTQNNSKMGQGQDGLRKQPNQQESDRDNPSKVASSRGTPRSSKTQQPDQE